MATESGFASKGLPAEKNKTLPLQFSSGDGGFSSGGTTSLPLLKPCHNTLHCTTSNRSIQFSENLLSVLYPCLTSADDDGKDNVPRMSPL